MKQIIAVINPYLVEKVIAGVSDCPVEEIAIREVKGFGRQKNYLERYLDNEYSGAFVPKVELSIWCDDQGVEAVIEAVTKVCCTGRMGDGKIFVMPVLGQIVTSEK